MADHNRNPTGRNQHEAKLEDPGVQEALRDFHGKRITSNKRIAELMTAKGFPMSESTVKRFRKRLGLTGSRAISNELSIQEQEQYVLTRVDGDLGGHHGVRTIMQEVAFYDRVLHVPRRVVTDVMHRFYPDGFAQRAPGGRRVLRVEKHPLGPNERWSCDGHDKLNAIGIQIYSIVDDATSKRLGQWCVPNNREGVVIAFLYLTLVIELGGIPIQTASDCGSETTLMFGLQNALMEFFHSGETDVAPHSYVKSINNIAVERSWRTLGLDWGYSAVKAFLLGEEDGVYNPDDPRQWELARWLWSGILQRSLDAATAFRNGAPKRMDKNKIGGPNGIARDLAYDHPELWGGKDCLLPIDPDAVRAIRDQIADESILEFVSKEFALRAEAAFAQLGVHEANEKNGWFIFTSLFNILYPDV